MEGVLSLTSEQYEVGLQYFTQMCVTPAELLVLNMDYIGPRFGIPHINRADRFFLMTLPEFFQMSFLKFLMSSSACPRKLSMCISQRNYIKKIPTNWFRILKVRPCRTYLHGRQVMIEI